MFRSFKKYLFRLDHLKYSLMRTDFFSLKSLLLVLFLSFSFSCLVANTNESNLVLTGSTPGDLMIKRILNIPAQTPVDFIRWNLIFKNDRQFTLSIHFGESQPNTTGFKNGGEKRSVSGDYSVSGNQYFQQQYNLKSSDLTGMLSMVKLTENVFHLITPEAGFMIGNGGWSFSLNRSQAIASDDILVHSSGKEDKSVQVIYDGRTPCREIAAEHPEMKVSAACFKLKWRLILNRDPVTFLPTTFTIRKVIDGKAQHITGKWMVQKGTGTNAGQLIYTIEPDKPGESISFLVADQNVLFFLNKKNRPYTGNADFSFALNRNL
jgi:hypothetical protein